jgi:hypothetical protein
MSEMQNNNLPQDRDELWLLWAAPAPVDFYAFGRRAGEIIARAANAKRKGHRRDG